LKNTVNTLIGGIYEMLLDHKHLIVRATTNSFPKDTKELEVWLKTLVDKIDMKLAKGIKNNPSVYYCDMAGNSGLTGFAIIETSHIAIHIWDEVFPYLVQFDVFSCSAFNVKTVFDHLGCFDPVDISYKYIDRNENLIEILKKE
jgi:S-adenosylmethionine/arginine decarboxylase-like enzyme